MADADLVAYTREELDADADRQAKLHAAGAPELPSESQTGATLDLSHRRIRALPVEVIELIKDKVERLALSHNVQIALPSEIVQCGRLRYLNIRWNQLRVFPPEILSLKNLEILDLSKNRLTEIPEGIKNMTSLKFLAIARNNISRLPFALGEMTKLQKMMFDDNPIVFPPPETLKADSSTPLGDRERDVCQQVKRFMRTEMIKDKLRSSSEEDLSESLQETPRPPPRLASGRFPIRPSESGLERMNSLVASQSDDRLGRLHRREISQGASALTAKRPTASPLVTDTDLATRSRSETVSSASSIRSRRQGYVPTRLAAAEPVSISETVTTRIDPSLTARKSHWHETTERARATSGSIVTRNGQLASATNSPMDGSRARSASAQHQASPHDLLRNGSTQDQSLVKAAQRIRMIFDGLQLPLRSVIVQEMATTSLKQQEIYLSSALEKLSSLRTRLDSVLRPGLRDASAPSSSSRSVFSMCVLVMQYFAALTRDLRANFQKLVVLADAINVRALMFQLHCAMVELRNICTFLGFKVKHPVAKETARVSQAWSSRTVTPTQPSRVSRTRLRGATILQSMGDSTFRAMPPPSLPIHSSRSTAVSSGPPTARSGEFSSAASSRAPSMSRSNTLRSVTDESDSDQQFDQIFLGLKKACELAALGFPAMRTEIVSRKEKAQSEGQSIAARDWDRAFTLHEMVMANEMALLKRLGSIRLNDPAVRHQGDFWQLCDKFVQSWTDLASHIKALSSRKLEVSHIKSLMREAQKTMKIVSKTISNSPLYHQGGTGASNPTNFATSGTSQLLAAFPSGLASQAPIGYVTPLPATPLSAALGPAVQATVASSANDAPVPREYYPAAPTATRLMHERTNTVVPPPAGYAKRP